MAVIPDDQVAMMLEAVERLARERIAPRAMEVDRSAQFPRDLYRAMAELGLFGLCIPEQYGGLGADLRTILLVIERIARASAVCALSLANCGDASTPIALGGSDALKRRYLPGIASGELIPCFALTEPQAGSDAAAIETRAVRQGDRYVLNGRKVFCTNGSVGDLFVVFAKTDPGAGSRGVSAILVPRQTAGLSVGRDEELLGLRGSPTTELTFEDVTVPADHLLGIEGGGFTLAMQTLDDSRLNAATIALGIARAAVQIAVEYARSREQFGKPIVQHQGLAFLLAEVVTELNAGWALLGSAIEALERERNRAASTQAAMAKLFCTDVAMRATTEAVQVLGGYGLTRDFVVERLMRDVKAFQIFDGTNQIQKLIIGRHLEKAGLLMPDRW